MQASQPILIIVFFLAFGTANSAGQSTSEIIQSIQSLESRNDPKCYATASRLEDFMFGTPLSFEARAGKNLLQRNLVADVWLRASSSVKDRGDKSVTPADIEKAVETVMVISVNGSGHFEAAFNEDQYRRKQKEGLRELSRLLLSNQSSLDQITILRESGIILGGNSGHQILAAATSKDSAVHIMQISLDKGDGTLLLASASSERSVNTSELDNALSELLTDLRWR